MKARGVVALSLLTTFGILLASGTLQAAWVDDGVVCERTTIFDTNGTEIGYTEECANYKEHIYLTQLPIPTLLFIVGLLLWVAGWFE